MRPKGRKTSSGRQSLGKWSRVILGVLLQPESTANSKTSTIREICERQHVKYLSHTSRMPNFSELRQRFVTSERDTNTR